MTVTRILPTIHVTATVICPYLKNRLQPQFGCSLYYKHTIFYLIFIIFVIILKMQKDQIIDFLLISG
jgi:hypothetical protein